MRFNFVSAIQFVIANIDQFKELYEDGAEFALKVKELFEKYQQSQEPLAMGASVELCDFLDANPIVSQLAFASACPSCADEITAMTGPGTAIAVIKFLATYGPLIKQIVDAWKANQ